MIIEKLYNAFSDIIYYDNGHYYLDNKTGEILPSVTQLIKRHKQVFRKDFWSRRKADERGISVEDILSEWENQKVYGTTRGSLVHDYLEETSRRKKYNRRWD